MVNPAPSRRNTLVGVGAGVVGGVALLSLVALNMQPGRPAVVATPTTSIAPTAIATPTVAAPTTVVSPPTPGAATPTRSVTPTRTPTSSADGDDEESTTPRPQDSPSVSPSPRESGEPSTNGAVVTSLTKDSYVTVYKWLSKKTTSAAEAAAYAEEQAGKGGHNPIAFDGDAVPGMNPGYWGIGVPGARTFSESRQVCVELGFAPNGSRCWARLVK